MRVLVTGAKGMLGTDLMARLSVRHDVVGTDVDEADITDGDEILARVLDARPDWVVHGAAFTNVDGCEKEPGKAFKVNAEGSGHVALACRAARARMAYVSTDYVFDGRKGEPYVESDPVGPLNVYGDSKLKGEQAALSVLPDALVVRTSWLFGLNGPNFVEAILAQVGVKEELKVVSDQVGSPTYTADLAGGIARLVEAGASGVVHLTNEGQCSWHEYAVKILELAGAGGIRVLPVTTEELGRPALRPAYSVLSKERYYSITGHRMRAWPEALADYMDRRGRKSR